MSNKKFKKLPDIVIIYGMEIMRPPIGKRELGEAVRKLLLPNMAQLLAIMLTKVYCRVTVQTSRTPWEWHVALEASRKVPSNHGDIQA